MHSNSFQTLEKYGTLYWLMVQKSLIFLTLIYRHNILVLLHRFLAALINVIVAFLPAEL